MSETRTSPRKKSRKSETDDDSTDDEHLYIPSKTDPAKLDKITAQEHPEIRKYLSLTKPELQKWLRHNAQLVTGRKHDLLLRCVDGQINGRIPGCERCHHGQMQYDYTEGLFVCNGYFDKMSATPIRCGHTSRNVKRGPWRDLEKDEPAKREDNEEKDEERSGHHSDHPEHHHDKHSCKVEANHPIVDLLEDMAYFHSVLKDENWGYKARAFKTAARAIEETDFEIKDTKGLGDSKDERHIERVGKSSAEVIKVFLQNNKRRSPQLEDIQKRVSEHHKQ